MFDGPDEFEAAPVELVILVAVPLVELDMLVALGTSMDELLLPPCCWQ